MTEQRIEYERLQQTLADLTQQLADSMKAQEGVRALEGERDSCRREVSKFVDETSAPHLNLKYDRANKPIFQIDVLETQLADLSRQVVVLTREVAIRDDPSLADEEFTNATDMEEDGALTLLNFK